MRKAVGLGLALYLLSGCSSDSNQVTTGAGPAPAPGASVLVPPTAGSLAVTPQNASAVASAVLFDSMVAAFVPEDAAPQLESLPAASEFPNSTALGLALGLALHGPGVINGPLGGTATIERDGSVQFTNLVTPHAVVNGGMRVDLVPSGAADFTSSVEFRDITVSTQTNRFTLRGPAGLAVSRKSGRYQVVWTANFTADEGSRGTTAYRGLRTESTVIVAGQNAEQFLTMAGELQLTNRHGQSGSVIVSTPKPLAFTGTVSNNAARLRLDAGSLALNGAQLQLDITGANKLSVASNGTAVKTVSFAYLGGLQRLLYALRPVLADSIFQDGTFVTMNDSRPSTDALAVLDGKILALGASGVAPFRGPDTRTVPLHGKTCLPGFIEAHLHVNLTALQLSANVNSKVVACGNESLGNSIETATSALQGAVAKNPSAGAIYGFNFDPSRLIPSELMQNLTRQQLDAISSTIPIVVQNASQHISYCNTAALRQSKIWPTAPNPPFNPPQGLGSFVVTDSNGLPTGQLNEFAQAPALEMALAGVFSTPAEKEAYLAQWRQLMTNLAKVGVTTAADMLTGSFLKVEGEAAVFTALELDPTNPVRLRAYLDSTAANVSDLRLFAGEGNDRLKFIGAKFVSDGSTQGLTAGLNFNYIFPGPFPVAPNGLMDFMTALDLATAIQPWFTAGFQPAIHANGDRALEQLYQAMGLLTPASGVRDRRFRIEHFTVHTDAELQQHIATAKQLNIAVGHTIGHVFFWGQVFNNTLLGPAVSKNIDPIASLMAAGVPVATHSDSPVTTPNPLRDVQIASTRTWQNPPVQVLGPEQIVSVPQALKTVTTNAAFSLLADSELGSLEPGKYADLVILGQDPTRTPANQVGTIPVVATYLAGERLSGVEP